MKVNTVVSHQLEFDIYNDEPRQVVCISNKNNAFFNCDENSTLLTVGVVYNLEEVEVCGWHTVVYLEEFPGVEFNSVCFGEIAER